MQQRLDALISNITGVILGKDDVVRLAVAALLARGHLLIEDAPGLGKTMLARAIAQSIHGSFQRIQFTPDLLPSDVTGVSIFHPGDQRFEFVPGPIFANVLLADEINRTSPRTQSCLLEGMAEGQVTIEGHTRPLEELFFVIATQNPVELAGTFPLPEAQLDRFLMRLAMGYPTESAELGILSAQTGKHPIEQLGSVLDVTELLLLQKQVQAVHIGEELRQYIVRLCAATRTLPGVRLGISPRGSLALMHAAQAWSFVAGHSYVTPDAVKAVAEPVLAHRLLLDPHRELAGSSPADVVGQVLDDTPVPTRPHDR